MNDAPGVDANYGVVTPTRRVERKYFVDPSRTALALGLLHHTCRIATDYPRERINSLYFDSPDLAEHQRSMAGEFEKRKVRVRWYGPTQLLKGTVPCFIELKSREGFASSKRRRRIEVDAQALQTDALSKGIVPRSLLIDTLAEFGCFVDGPLVPVASISYFRVRFMEVTGGNSVAFDSHIESRMFFPACGCGERAVGLEGSVIEVKGPRVELPIPLRQLKMLGTDWTRFSKYSSCIESHLSQVGELGRTWPPGRMPV